ncbi:hypothetical protein OAJ13_00790 [Euryarchaeota archaeon]|nr:hypothetical protein [Euryarchaeota archaeon]|tara:strand:- start:288 stop:410 length:123 start_codon:yes stop_codon:yes gene_type:complete
MVSVLGILDLIEFVIRYPLISVLIVVGILILLGVAGISTG